MWGKSGSIRSTVIAFLQWELILMLIIRSSPMMKRLNSGNQSTLQIFWLKIKTVSLRNHKKEGISSLKGKSLLLWGKTKEKYSKCQEIWPEWNCRNSLLWKEWLIIVLDKSKKDILNVFVTKMTISTVLKNCTDNVWFIGAKKRKN